MKPPTMVKFGRKLEIPKLWDYAHNSTRVDALPLDKIKDLIWIVEKTTSQNQILFSIQGQFLTERNSKEILREEFLIPRAASMV